MKERPILFSAPMVRALLDGSKTQTRRVVKAKHLPWLEHIVPNFLDGKWNQRPLPYGQTGDRLWVRERFRSLDCGEVDYFADGPQIWERMQDHIALPDADKWKPSIHMPRWASRITLEITSVRVERLQDISKADAIAEGIERLTYGGLTTYRNYSITDDLAEVSPMLESPIESYRTLWESITGPSSWDANPFVWVIEFKRVEQAA